MSKFPYVLSGRNLMYQEMDQNVILLLPVLIPIAAGILLLTVKRLRSSRKAMLCLVVAALTAGALCAFAAVASGGGLTLWKLTDTITIELRVDGISRLFAVLTAVVWLLVGIYSITYMTHERDEHRFFGFYLIVLGVLIGLDFSANLVTMYVFYELMTLTSLPLVLHELTKEAVMAGLKYLFYSVAGAFLALFGILFLASISGTLAFTSGGVLGGVSLDGKKGILLAAVCCMLLGFGTKAGMFPMHGWLPTAHPVAPAPASAVLSGLITKSGVLAVIRVVYYIVGPELLRGTWVQTMWILLSLLTVFMGRVMPVMLGGYTVLSLALIGIPPCSGFVSKWYLACGALASGTGVWTIAGPAVLLISALLTAGYLLPLTIHGFFPGEDFDESELKARGLIGREPSLCMMVPILIFTAGALLFGCFPGRFLAMLESIAAAVL